MSQKKCPKCKKILDGLNGSLQFCPFCGTQIDAAEPRPVSYTPDTDSLLKRVYIFLEDGNFYNANVYCEKILDINPECAEAYLGKLMANLKVRRKDDLEKLPFLFDNHPLFPRLMSFADDELKSFLTNALTVIRTRALDKIYAKGLHEMNYGNFDEAISVFSKIPHHKNAMELINSCRQTKEKNAILEQTERAKFYLENDYLSDVKKAISILTALPQTEETTELLERAKTKKEQLTETNRRNMRKFKIIVSALLIFAVAFTIAWHLYFKDLAEYRKACNLAENKDYVKAISIFEKLGDFSDSKEKILEARYNLAFLHLENAEHEKAYNIFKNLGNYKDVKTHLGKFEWVATKIHNDEFIHEFKYDKNGLMVEEVYKYDEYSSDIRTFEHNNEGLLTVNNCHGESGVHTHKYQYNKNGLLIKETKDDSYIEYEYNKDGLLLKATETYNHGSTYITEYEYNKDGLVTKETNLRISDDQDTPEEEFRSENIFEYNKDGLLTKETYIDQDGEEDITEYKYEYNKDGLLTKKTYTRNTHSQAVYEYEYNKDGILVKETEAHYTIQLHENGEVEKLIQSSLDTYNYVLTPIYHKFSKEQNELLSKYVVAYNLNCW